MIVSEAIFILLLFRFFIGGLLEILLKGRDACCSTHAYLRMLHLCNSFG